MKRLPIGLAAPALTALALAMLTPSAAEASIGYMGWGPRMGLTGDPDQVHVGLHFDFGSFADNVRFQPNVEVGVGDNVTLVTLNYEAAYRFNPGRHQWTPYLGGGLGVNHMDWDNDRSSRFDDSETDLGLNVLMGIEKGQRDGDRFFTELKLGLAEPPDFKLTFGWTFY